MIGHISKILISDGSNLVLKGMSYVSDALLQQQLECIKLF